MFTERKAATPPPSRAGRNAGTGLGLSVSLNTAIGLRVTNVQECAVCHQLVDDAIQRDDAAEILFFGAAKHAWCPACNRKVDRALWTVAYKRRWQAYIADKRAPRPVNGALVNSRGIQAVVVIVGRADQTAELRVAVGIRVEILELASIEEATRVAGLVFERLQQRGFRFARHS